MQTITIYTINVPNKGEFVIGEEVVPEYRDDVVIKRTFPTKTHTGATALKLAQSLASSRIFTEQGTGDTTAIAAVRGRFLMQILVDGALKQTGTEEPVSVFFTGDNVEEVPAVVAREFNARIEGFGLQQSELDALKKVSSPSE